MKVYRLLENAERGRALRTFSRIQDEDFLEDSEKRRREVKRAPLGMGAAGGIVGGALGASTKSGTAALIGAGLGAGAGYIIGRREKKRVNEEEDRRVKRYLSASARDREYLRRRMAHEARLRLQQKQADNMIVAGYLAGR